MSTEYIAACKISYNGGRTKFAAALDFVFFNLLRFFAIFLLALQLTGNSILQLLLSIIGTMILALVSSIIRNIRFNKHVQELRARTKQQLIRQKLLCIPNEILHEKIALSYGQGCHIIQRDKPLEPDAIYEAIRHELRANTEKLIIVSIAGISDDAEKCIESLSDLIDVEHVSVDRITAITDAITVSSEEIDAAVIRQFKRRKKEKVRFNDALLPNRIKKYVIIGILLYVLSFFVKYGLFMRITASLSFMAAGIVFALNEIAQRKHN